MILPEMVGVTFTSRVILVSASLQDISRRHLRTHGTLDNLAG